MYIETKFYDNGKSEARLHQSRPDLDPSEGYDTYIDECEALEEWFEGLVGVGADETAAFTIDLNRGEWIDISAYC